MTDKNTDQKKEPARLVKDIDRAHVDRLLMATITVIGLGLLGACSKPAPEERLIEVGQDVSDMQTRLKLIDAEITTHENAIQQLRKERQNAKAKLMTLEERLQRRATDLAIFRAAQSALLDEPTLQEAAVLASVEDGIVTLNGSVSSAQEEQKATDIVRAIPGVESTVVRLQLIDESGVDEK